MMDEGLVYRGQEMSLAEFFKNAVNVIKPADAPLIKGFNASLNVLHSNTGKNIRFWKEIPRGIAEDSVSWDPSFTHLKSRYALKLYLKFRSKYFFDDPSGIEMFMSEWSVAIRNQENEQHQSVKQLLRVHPISAVNCFGSSSGTVRMRMDFDLTRTPDVSLVSIVW